MDPLVDEVELLQANPHYAHVRYPDGRETTVATKHLAPKGHMEVAETLPQPEPIPEKAEILPLDTSVNVMPDAGPSSVNDAEPSSAHLTPDTEPLSASEPELEPQPERASVQNAEPAPVRRSQ